MFSDTIKDSKTNLKWSTLVVYNTRHPYTCIVCVYFFYVYIYLMKRKVYLINEKIV